MPRFRFNATVKVYFPSDYGLPPKTHVMYNEVIYADSLEQARSSVGAVVYEILSDCAAELFDAPVDDTKVMRLEWLTTEAAA
jgi:hypothetical protein